MAHLKSLRKHVVYLLTKGGAHATFEEAVKDVPPAARGKKPEGGAHSLWDLVEHMRIAQWDILEFSRNAKHISPKFPKGYWPKTPAPPNAKAWDKSIKDFLADREELSKLIEKKSTDLFADIPHGNGQTILGEALLAADHNAYTVGEIVLTRRLLGVWKK